MKIVIEIPEKTNAHIRSDYGHGMKCLFDKDVEILCDAIYHGTPYEERPHGEWEKYGDKIEAYDISGIKTWGQKRKCTNCGFIKTYIEDFGFYSICPNCGADMIGKKDDLAEIIEAVQSMKEGGRNDGLVSL